VQVRSFLFSLETFIPICQLPSPQRLTIPFDIEHREIYFTYQLSRSFQFPIAPLSSSPSSHPKMAGPDLGALGATFKICRVLQAVSLIAIIGMTANFVAEIVSAKTAPPAVLIGTLSVVSLPQNPSLTLSVAHEKYQTSVAVLYCVITFILFMDGILPFLVNTAMDSLLLIAVIVVAVTVGKPLSYLDCKVIGQVSGAASSAYAFTTALGDSLDQDGGKIDYNHWIGGTKSTCLEMKSVWGLSIALW